MKKFLTVVLSALFLTLTAFGLTSCGSKKTVTFYMPDGATALSAAKLMIDGEFDMEVDYKVIDASLISSCVTGETPKADVCILPVNLASKLLGSGESYKMLGTVTHGNLYLLKKGSAEDITPDNIEILKDKTVGVIQLANVPGLTFKAILEDNGLEYAELGNESADLDGKVKLKAVAPEQVLPSDTTCDYFVVPEPAATTKVNATGGKLSFAGDLQELYGGDNGYPQGVLVAKNSLIESSPEFIASLISKITESAQWLLSESASAEIIANAVQQHLTEGLNPLFTASDLSRQVIEHCAVKFVNSLECKDEVNSFLEKLIRVNASSASPVSDNFYYIGK